MLKFLKNVLLVLGAVVIVGAALLMLWEARLRTDSLNAIVSAAVNSKSFPNEYYNSTINGVWLAAGIGVLGGLVLGLGIGVPSVTFKKRYEQRQAADAAKAEAAKAEADKVEAAKLAKSTAAEGKDEAEKESKEKSQVKND